jgi:hypothetical protein
MKAERVELLWREFAAASDLPGSVIDNSDLAAYEAADRLQSLTTSGVSVIWHPG